MDAETQRYIQREVKKQLQIILSGQSQNSDKFTEDIYNMFPGMGGIIKRPIMRPFGFMSQASNGTTQVTGRMGEHEANRFVMGHRDQNAPDPAGAGTAQVYSAGGYQIRVLNNAVQVGKGGVWETQVVGETLAAALSAMIAIYNSHVHSNPEGGNVGPATPDMSTVTSDFISNGKFLAKDGGRF